MSKYREWAGGAVQVTAPKPKFNAWVEGRFIMYVPTFFPSADVKEWGGVRWDGKHKAWRIPRLARNVKKIAAFDPDATMSKEVQRLLNDWDIPTDTAEDMLLNIRKHPALSAMYPFQHSGAASLIFREYHGKLLVLSPGLGKTATSIVAADLYARKHNVKEPRFLVVAPRPLNQNWLDEINGPLDNDNLPKRVQEHGWSIYDDDPIRVYANDRTRVGENTWTVTNPEALFERKRAKEGDPLRLTGQLAPEFNLDWDVVILDESVLYKHRKAKRSQIVKTLAHSAHQVWMLSGAPITHDNSDIWQQFNIAEPDYFSSFWTFAHEFCIVEQTPWSMGQIVGSRHGMHLRQEYPEMMFVRNQEEVFDDLPSVIFQDVDLPLTRRQKKAHDDLLADWFHELEYNSDSRIDVARVIAQLTRLQQVTSNLKNLETTGKYWPDESTKADVVESFVETGDIMFPALIWVWHRPGAHALYDRLVKWSKKKGNPLSGKRIEMVLGKTKKADELIRAYKKGEVDVLILSIGVGKYGHTLANSRDVIYFDRTWDSDAMFQSLHRYAGARGLLAGYTHQPRVRILRCRGTVDDFVELNLAGKLPDMAALTGADLLKILRSLGANFIEEDHA